MDEVLPSQQKRTNSYIAKHRVAWLVEFLFEHLPAVKFSYAVITSHFFVPGLMQAVGEILHRPHLLSPGTLPPAGGLSSPQLELL